ncbi:hypothetical protein ACPCK1_05790 [Streptomyces pseudogriseolus]|uniref:hypothetical protein n=1 Tax=Streptomyces pseudogriseolus TaxID=36817 RepID=UPI003FA26E4B
MTTMPTVTGRPDGPHLIAPCPYCRGEHVHGRGTGPALADCHPIEGLGAYHLVDPDEPEVVWQAAPLNPTPQPARLRLV